MNLALRRKPSTANSTPGDLFLEEKRFCHTLEDPVREMEGQPVSSWKIPGTTAIPRGRYRIVVNWSGRFQQFLPILLDVPGFTGIRIHPGNTAKDTEGCILVGRARTVAQPDFLGDSRAAMAKLLPVIANACDKGEEVWITVE